MGHGLDLPLSLSALAELLSESQLDIKHTTAKNYVMIVFLPVSCRSSIRGHPGMTGLAPPVSGVLKSSGN